MLDFWSTVKTFGLVWDDVRYKSLVYAGYKRKLVEEVILFDRKVISRATTVVYDRINFHL